MAAIEAILGRLRDDRFDRDHDLQALRRELVHGALWDAARHAVSRRSREPLEPWWEVLTTEAPLEAVYKSLDRLGDQQGIDSPHIGTIAIHLLTCAAIASWPLQDAEDPWHSALIELARGGRTWQEARAPLEPAALTTAMHEFVNSRNAKWTGAAGALQLIWPQVLRTQLNAWTWTYPISAAWAWDAICQLWGIRRVQHRCRVPVVAYGGAGNDASGFLATLVLESFEEVADETPATVCHDPAHAFLSFPGDATMSSLADAFHLARPSTLQNPGSATAGRWCVLEGWHGGGDDLNEKRRPLQSCGGTSAGGAALRGWMHALRGWVPDSEVVVIAGVDSARGALKGLNEKVREKVQGVVEFNREVLARRGHDAGRPTANAIDTIIVATAEDGWAAFEGLGVNSDIRIVLFDSKHDTYLLSRDKTLTPMHTLPPT